MKISQQHIDYFEPITRRNKNLSLIGTCAQFTMLCCGFQCTQAGRAHGDHAPLLHAGECNRIDGRLREGICLAMHHVVAGILDAHWLKGARADMQRDLRGADT